MIAPAGRYACARGRHRDSRHLPFSALFNFRDVGGYPGHAGRTVRRGRLYRSDSLHRLDGTDREAFGALGIRTVIDLRRPREVERDGRVPDYAGAGLPRTSTPSTGTGREQPYRPGTDLARYLADRYADLGETGDRRAGRGGRADRRQPRTPRWWCTASPARTAPASSARLTLAALGVSDADIAADYALSTDASASASAPGSHGHLPDGRGTPRAVPGRPRPRRCRSSSPSCARATARWRATCATPASPTAQLDALRAHLLA